MIDKTRGMEGLQIYISIYIFLTVARRRENALIKYKRIYVNMFI